MRSTFASILALAATAVAQTAGFDPIYTPSDSEVVPAGSTYKVTWSAPAQYKNVKVDISLIGGASQATLQTVGDVASGVANSAEQYQWSVPEDLGDDAVYGLVFKVAGNPDVFQYSQPFKIKAASKAAPSSSSVAAAPEVTSAPAEKAEAVTKTVGVDVTTTDCPIADQSSATTLSTAFSKPIPSVVPPPVIPSFSAPPAVTPTPTPAYGTPTPTPTPSSITTPGAPVPTAAGVRVAVGPAVAIGAALVALAAF